jgi:hypothetical protein
MVVSFVGNVIIIVRLAAFENKLFSAILARQFLSLLQATGTYSASSGQKFLKILEHISR